MVIHMEDVSLRRNGTYILKDINWNVKAGEHWAIIGLNGSGKTSLLKMINGYTFPSSGEVTVLGKKFGAYDLRELRKSIGWVSSSLLESLYFGESAEEIVLSGKYATIGLYDEPSKEDIDKASVLLNQFGCTFLAKRTYQTLSQGEKQKVLLARALMSTPKLLVLDEPCTGLDIFARESFLSLVEDLGAGDNAPTILYVSHHIEEILPVIGNVLLLTEGRIHSAGSKETVLSESNLKNFLGRSVEINWTNARPSVRIIN